MRREMRVWAAVLLLWAVQSMLAQWLDGAGLLARMLSPWGADVYAGLLAAVAMFTLRLGLLFLAPGWLLARAIRRLR